MRGLTVLVKRPGQPLERFETDDASVESVEVIIGSEAGATTIATRQGDALRMFYDEHFSSAARPENFPFNGDTGFFVRGVAVFLIAKVNSAQLQDVDDNTVEAVNAYISGLPELCRKLFTTGVTPDAFGDSWPTVRSRAI